MKISIFTIALVSLLAIALGNCNGFETINYQNSKTLNAVIKNSNGSPIQGAVFYAEAYTHKSGVFDFAYGYTGPDGNIKQSYGETLTIKWRNNARLAIAAFAENYKPVVIYDPMVTIEADGIEITLQDLPNVGFRWEPRVAKLGFPFENHPDLAHRISTPDHKILLAAFFNAYKPLWNKEETALPNEWNKMKFLEKLINNAK
ncbi:hypothetical protein [Desulfosarcina ovata]|uniref:Uncharacterized protein n=2 Tax=Desulfosarcina ovata TaxID=83564 RepID=A0A5K8A893_9BACT|nr:hypothetical protein [Desulfosarcina ovata]BBO81498.1 hypothetical protein DSCO28_20640 [Desulfosarcina ovata subsp. sediminis]BBO88757.1 hypothetical protein DSCOOX_19370 [Desulfosarcina ovata subsp. ovata]